MATLTAPIPTEEEFIKELGKASVHYPRLFSEYSAHERTLIRIKLMNGKINEFFDKLAPERTKQIALWSNEKQNGTETNLTQKNGTKDESKTEEGGEDQEFIRHMFLPRVTIELFNLQIGQNFTFKEVIQKAADHYVRQRERFINPIIKILDIDDPKIVIEVERLAIIKFFSSPFGIVSCSSSESPSQIHAWARFVTTEYQRHIFGFRVTNTDEEIVEAMTKRRGAIVDAAVIAMVDTFGLEKEKAKTRLEHHFWSIMKEIESKILSNIGQ